MLVDIKWNCPQVQLQDVIVILNKLPEKGSNIFMESSCRH